MQPKRADILPGTISSIKPQKNNKERYSIYVDDQFVVGVAESTLLEFSLKKGMKLTVPLVTKIEQAEDRAAVREYCYRLLARRDHARRELIEKGRKKGYPREILEDVLFELNEKGYIDDADFARKFASDKARLNNWGPRKVSSALYRKGIDREVIQQSIDEAFREIDRRELFLELIQKKRRKFLREEDPYRRKKKIFDYLRRKGYTSQHIHDCLDELVEALD